MIAGSILLFSGCNGAVALPSVGELKVDKKLPKVTLTQNGVVTEMNEIAFEWKPIKDSNVDGIKIYRKIGDKNSTQLLATVSNRYATHYVDLDVKPDTKYHYIFRTYRDDVVSAKSKKLTVYSKPPLPSVAWIYARDGLPRMAKLLWRPHQNQAVKYYIIERKSLDDKKWQEVAKLRGRLQAEYIDTNLKDRYTYRYRVRVKTFEGIVSTPSEIVKVVTKPLPPVITGLQATTDLPKKIFLTWNRSKYKDFERYYLYRAKRKDGRYELIAKLYNNHFTDMVGEDGVSYFYKISQKDIDGLESKKDNYIVMGATLPKPIAPTLQDAKFNGKEIYLKWYKTDPRSVSYVVERHAKTGWFDEKIKNFKTSKKEFIDRDIVAGTTYTYLVYAIDKYGIYSKPSNEVQVEVKELKVVPIKKIQKSLPKEKRKKSLSLKKEESSVVVVPMEDDLSVESK
ncbi:Putative fibronectin domain-containing lipoprotein [hydrothermal vent metagenome]|uniref:Putative fibronectin domain-containing lipoprotein n=1 Tax=hydrothermal vent metagenome TaxID=652676 RepID=A0A1W1BE85_9ZZZZ